MDAWGIFMLLVRPNLLLLLFSFLSVTCTLLFHGHNKSLLQLGTEGNKTKGKMHLKSKVRTRLPVEKYLACMKRKNLLIRKNTLKKPPKPAQIHTNKQKNWSPVTELTVISVSKWDQFWDQEHIDVVLKKQEGKRFLPLISPIFCEHWRDQSCLAAAVELHWKYLMFFLINGHFLEWGWSTFL